MRNKIREYSNRKTKLSFFLIGKKIQTWASSEFEKEVGEGKDVVGRG